MMPEAIFLSLVLVGVIFIIAMYINMELENWLFSYALSILAVAAFMVLVSVIYTMLGGA